MLKCFRVVLNICVEKLKCSQFFSFNLCSFFSSDDEEEQREIRQSRYRYKRRFSYIFWRWFRIAERSILITETNFYSGHVKEQYRTCANQATQDPPYNTGMVSVLLNSGGMESLAQRYRKRRQRTPILTFKSPWTRFTQLKCWRYMKIFEHLWPPIRTYGLEEVKEEVPFVTASNWSLESMCCRNPQARMYWLMKRRNKHVPKPKHYDSSESMDEEDEEIAEQLKNAKRTFIMAGQIRSSLICVFAGLGLMILCFVAAMVWLQLDSIITVVIVLIVAFILFIPLLWTSVQVYRWYYNDGISTSSVKNNETGPEQSSEEGVDRAMGDDDYAMVQVWETVRVTQPLPSFCWVMYMLEMIIFLFFPGIALFSSGLISHGAIFTVLGFWSWLRLYFNPTSVLISVGSFYGTGVGHLDVDENDDEYSKRQRAQVLKETARLSRIIANISQGRHVGRWVLFLCVLVAFILITFTSAMLSEGMYYGRQEVLMAPAQQFYYEPADSIVYPTCHLDKGFELPIQKQGSQSITTYKGTPVALMDYSFLAGMAYVESAAKAQDMLDQWFGPGEVIDQSDFVQQYRNDTNTAGGAIYRLFSFKNNPIYSVLSISGSHDIWDWIVDSQLWSAAAMAQVVRAVLPAGAIWTYVLDDLVYFMNLLENDNIKEVSYYHKTTKLVEDLMSGYAGNDQFTTVHVTGASLGGGTAIITGAQTGASTVSISGPNAMMTRHTVDPPISREDLNTKVFNVIPDRDIVSRVDDTGDLFQRIQCRAPYNYVITCHSLWRTICELANKCGSEGRPIPCWCVEKFGYEKPIQNGTMTWEEACPS